MKRSQLIPLATEANMRRMGLPSSLKRNEPVPRSFVGRLLPVVVLLATLGFYLPILGHEFLHWDDWYMIAENARLTQPTFDGLMAFWSEPSTGQFELYTPVSYSALWLLAAVFGIRPAVIHLGSLVLHLLNTTLVMGLAARLISREIPTRPRSVLIALAGGLFALHPMQVEAVAWASSFNTLLATAFSLGATYAWVGLSQSNPRGRVGRIAIVGALCVAATAAKPSAIMVPLALLALDLLILRRSLQQALIATAILMLAILPLAVIARSIQPAANVDSPLLTRPLIAMDTVGFYVAQLVFPSTISADYARYPRFVLEHWAVPPYFALGIGLLALAVVMYRRRPLVSAAIAILLVALLPVLGLTTFQFEWFSTVADRYLYLPLGLALPLVIAAINPKPLGLAACVVCLLALAARATFALPVWQDDFTFATHQIKCMPDSSVGHRLLGDYYHRQNDDAEAEKHYLICIAKRPDDFTVQRTLGEYYAGLNDVRADEHYAICLRLRPNDFVVLYNLGNLRFRQNRLDEALELYVRAIRAGTTQVEVFNNAFATAQKLNQLPHVGEAYAEALHLNPRNASAHAYYGWVLGLGGNRSAALQHFDAALSIEPNQVMARKGIAQLGALP